MQIQILSYPTKTMRNKIRIDEIENLIEQALQENFVVHMANVKPIKNDPTLVFIGNATDKHGPRIKVSNVPNSFTGDAFVMSISKNPEILSNTRFVKLKNNEINKIKEWIKLNYDELIIQWNNSLSGVQYDTSKLRQVK